MTVRILSVLFAAVSPAPRIGSQQHLLNEQDRYGIEVKWIDSKGVTVLH